MDLSTFFILNVIISLVFQGLLHWVVRADYILNIDVLTKMMSAEQTSSNYFQKVERSTDSIRKNLVFSELGLYRTWVR